MFYVDAARCNGCGTCLDACPQEAISLEGNRADINHSLCIECGICLELCPRGAIYETAGVPQRPAYAFARPQNPGIYQRSAVSKEGKEVSRMPFGRGWFGWGGGWGGGCG